MRVNRQWLQTILLWWARMFTASLALCWAIDPSMSCWLRVQEHPLVFLFATLAGALVPGIMSQGFLAAMIHRWAPEGDIVTVDTVFRAPVIVDQAYSISGVVTDIDEAQGLVEIDLTVVNDANETRVFGTATVRLPN